MPVEYTMNPLAPLSVGADLYAGAMAQEAQEQANAVEARRYKQQAHYQRKMDRKNIELQKQFAQQSIRWKVADAEAAGIHPLYALGSQASSFTPVSVGGPATSGRTPETGMANALAQSGQDISRAIHATRTATERDQAYADSMRNLQLQNMSLQNDLLASQIRRSLAVGPPGPSLNPVAMGDMPEKLEQVGSAVGTGGKAFGVNIHPNPWFSDVQGWLEQRLGDDHPITRAFGYAIFGADAAYNAGLAIRRYNGYDIRGLYSGDNPFYNNLRMR